MRFLLDTHIYLWCVNDEPKLSSATRSMILNAEHVYVSSVSIWEISIKSKLGKLEGDVEELVAAISESGFLELPFTAKHASLVAKLTGKHRDPFDRALVAQAMCEPLKLLTADSELCQYSELVVTV